MADLPTADEFVIRPPSPTWPDRFDVGQTPARRQTDPDQEANSKRMDVTETDLSTRKPDPEVTMSSPQKNASTTELGIPSENEPQIVCTEAQNVSELSLEASEGLDEEEGDSASAIQPPLPRGPPPVKPPIPNNTEGVNLAVQQWTADREWSIVPMIKKTMMLQAAKQHAATLSTSVNKGG